MERRISPISEAESHKTQFNPATDIIVPEGTYYIKADFGAVNTNVPKEEAAACVASINTQERIYDEFVKNTDVVVDVGPGQVVSSKEPSGKYSAHSQLITATDLNHLENYPNMTVNHEYDSELMREYHRQLVVHLLALHETTPKEEIDDVSIWASENVISEVTNLRTRTSRSVIVPHGQVHKHINDEIVPKEVGRAATEQDRMLAEEQAILQQEGRMTRFMSRLMEEMMNSDELQPVMGMRKAPPYGYYMEINLDAYDIAQDVNDAMEQYENMLREHHNAFVKVSARYEQKAKQLVSDIKDNPDRLIPHSYRRYTKITPNGKLLVIISPEFWSPSGVMEAAGVDFKRGPEYPKREPNVPKEIVLITASTIQNRALYHDEEDEEFVAD